MPNQMYTNINVFVSNSQDSSVHNPAGTCSMITWLSTVCCHNFAVITGCSSGQSYALQKHFWPHILSMWDIFALSQVYLMTLKSFDNLPY